MSSFRLTLRRDVLARALTVVLPLTVAAVVAMPALAQDDEEEDSSFRPATRSQTFDFPTLYERASLGDAVNGEKLFRIHYSACFGWYGRGDGPLATGASEALPNLRDGDTMNQYGDDTLRTLLGGGIKNRAGELLCPTGTSGFGELELNDVIAYVRTLHPKVGQFFPEAKWFLASRYEIDSNGSGRMAKAFKRAVAPDELKNTVFTVFRAMELAENLGAPRLVDQEPQKLARLKKKDRIGYLVFMKLTMQGFGSVPVAVSLDNNGTLLDVTALDAPTEDAKKLSAIFKLFQGKGKRGGQYAKTREMFEVKDKAAKPYADAVFQAWVRALEASYMFERDERDRTLLDEDFERGEEKPAEGEADVEEGGTDFNIKN